jgi:hypothetical protein
MEVFVVFKYEWSDRENGNYAIRRKDTKSKPAGKEIELKNKQTSDTHLFISINENDTDTMYNRIKINKILETVNFEYVYTGSNKKPLSKYLTKKDIDKLFTNIEGYKNKTVRIEIPFSKEKGALKKKFEINIKNVSVIYEKLYEGRYYDIIGMLKESVSKEQLLKKKQMEAELRIRKINAEIKAIKNNLSEYETTIKTEREKLEKKVFHIMKGRMKDLEYNGGDNNFQNDLKLFLYPLAKNEMKREAGNKIQKRYRDKKIIESGKPMRKAGRPKKIKNE